MALHVSPAVDAVHETRERIIELVGTRTETVLTAAPVEETPAMLAVQLQLIDNFVEMIRMRTEIAEKDLRVADLTAGIHTWRERAAAEQAARRLDAAEAREREREIVSLLHQQMLVADAATAELERIRALPRWRRIFA